MSEVCRYCIDKDFLCQEPSVPLIQGRWKISPDGKKVNLEPEKMEKCAKRVAILNPEITSTCA